MPTLNVWLTENAYARWVRFAEGRATTGAKLAGDVIARVIQDKKVQRVLELEGM